MVQADPGYQLEIKETLALKPADFRIRVKRRHTAAGSFKPQRLGSSSVTTQTPQPLTQPQTLKDGASLLVLYGSDSGSSEAFAQRVASEAAGQGYAADLSTLDEHGGNLPKNGTVVIVTASGRMS